MEIDNNKIFNLLAKITPILNENKDLRAQKETKGELFNIFSLLNMEWDEVHTHTPFLAELLNPVGSHGAGDTFLRLFINEMPLNNIKNGITTCSAIITSPKDIGPINLEKETGGEIDILIEFSNPKYAIIIENKILAGDQPKQLARYHNYIKEKYGNNFTLFYLTLDGSEPSKESTGRNTPEHYWTCISYKEKIKSWLDKCFDNSKNYLINGTVKQYINLIDKITGQELETKMSEEITKIMQQNLEETLAIFDSKTTFDIEIYDLFREQMEEIAKETNCNLDWAGEIWDRGTDQFIYFTPHNNPTFKIGVGKDSGSQTVFYLEKKGTKKNQMKLACFTEKPYEGYHYGYKDFKYHKWDSQTIRDIWNGKLKTYTKENIIEIINEISNI